MVRYSSSSAQHNQNYLKEQLSMADKAVNLAQKPTSTANTTPDPDVFGS
jgi:hypothetical protein